MFLFKMDNLFLNQPDLYVDLEHVLKENLEITGLTCNWKN